MPIPLIPVKLSNGCEWEIELHSAAVGRLLLQLATHDHRTIARVVGGALNLPSRKERAEMLRSKGSSEEREATLHQHRLINKAMSMELLCASLLAHLDSAEDVVSHCSALCSRPYHYAISGASDLTATYAGSRPDGGFRILGEVSAKRHVSTEDWLGQLNRAVVHALKLRKQNPDRPVYALVVNGGRIGENRALRQAYQAFVKDRELKRDGDIRVVPMATVDVAHALLLLERELPGDQFRFGADRLAQCSSWTTPTSEHGSRTGIT